MDSEIVLVGSIVAALSLVQSFFGIGLLVFGTPTFLILGYDFYTTLGFLLPASFGISLLQVMSGASNIPSTSKALYLFCLPGIVAGLVILEFFTPSTIVAPLVGGTLVLSAVLRIYPPSYNFASLLLRRYSGGYHVLMGFVHGLTNLGGALLVIYASAIYNDKEQVRGLVAFYYLAFSFIQMLTLYFSLGHTEFLRTSILLMLLSMGIHLILGNRVFRHANNAVFNNVLTTFMAAYGGLLFFNL